METRVQSPASVVRPRDGRFLRTFVLASLLISTAGHAAPARAEAIPWLRIGAKAGADYQGDGLAVSPSAGGVRLRCVFQHLEGEVAREGLWLNSPGTNSAIDRFRILATAVGRGTGEWSSGLPPALLREAGTVAIGAKTARYIRPRLVEEYSVSVDGVRQDFLVLHRPCGEGKLRLQMAVAGAKAEALVDGARLVLNGSGRRLAYSRLRVTDAHGLELAARLEVTSANSLAVLVNDAAAVYPVRIDPTFSDENWISMGGLPGTDLRVYAAVVDGSNNLYLGGDFTIAGDVFANRIAKWNGNSWSALGSGVNGSVWALTVSGGDLYVGGSFTTAGGSPANGIAKWNGSGWSEVGWGLDGSAYAFAVSGGDLYVGGFFTTLTNVGGGTVGANRIAKWDGSSWSAVGWGVNGSVNAVAVSGSDLYLGGLFTTATNSGGATVTANRIAKWNGSNWSALGSGVNNSVDALAVSGSDLYVGGFFTTATNGGGGTVTVNRVAKWNGSSWSALGSGMPDRVLALAVAGSNVYAGGYFTTAGGIGATNIARWNGNSWSALGSGLSGNFANSFFSVYALAVSSNYLFAGGGITMAGTNAANRVALWDGNSWSALAAGFNFQVNALAVSSNCLYVGGSFRAAGGGPADRVVKWDGSSWTTLGTGLNNSVVALAVSGSELYVGGRFTNAGGTSASRIAKWDGISWSALGVGVNGDVNALAVSGGDLYVGGGFTTAGGSPASYIAKWNGSSWSPLASGMNNSVYALAVSGSNVYAGGYFTNAGGNAANFVAEWNGSSWTALGAGVSNGDNGTAVYALAFSSSNLYAGGDFTMAGGSAANYAAKWDGSSWSALGAGLGHKVNALAVSGTDLYAGGGWPMPSAGNESNYVAKWDGGSWTALGSGVGGTDSFVNALAVSGSDLYVGGSFFTAGGQVSPYLARAVINPAPALASPPFLDGGDFVVRYAGTPTSTYTIQFTESLSPVNWQTVTNLTAPLTNAGLGVGVFEFREALVIPGERFYRAVGP
jgi:Rax2 C-terminal beta propeller domain